MSTKDHSNIVDKEKDKEEFNMSKEDIEYITGVFKQLSHNDIKKIKKFGDDYIIPPRIAAKVKGVALGTIYYMIDRGDLVMARGILLSSLLKYKVSEQHQKAALIGIEIKKKLGTL